MVQSPSWEANWFATSQEIPRISRNPKVHYRTHKRPPPVSILGQPNPVHIPTSLLLQIQLNIIHPSTPMSPQWCLSLRFKWQNTCLEITDLWKKTFINHRIHIRRLLSIELNNFVHFNTEILSQLIQWVMYIFAVVAVPHISSRWAIPNYAIVTPLLYYKSLNTLHIICIISCPYSGKFFFSPPQSPDQDAMSRGQPFRGQ